MPSIDKVRAALSGADDRQVAAQHIDELRQAVDADPAKKRPNGSSAGSLEPIGPWQGMAFGTELGAEIYCLAVPIVPVSRAPGRGCPT